MSRRILLLSALVVLLAALPAAAQDERLLQFHSDITVQEDGLLLVRETIRVRATGEQIQRGIYRDFTGFYLGGTYLREVQREGRPEPHRIEEIEGGVRVYIGQEDQRLPPGEYTYTIVYLTKRQIGYFDGQDELYWNVTGNDWVFPIDQATATVRLPGGVARERIEVEAYTGPRGATGRDSSAEVDAEGVARFRTTAPLAAGEGLTLVVSWPKGFVVECAAPTEEDERLLGFHSDIAILGDGSMEVRETLRVCAAGAEIRRGIYRDFPTFSRTPWLLHSAIGFELLGVERNGEREPYHTRKTENGIRIYLGREDQLLPAGEHVYTVTYRAARALGFFDGHDELYWNVTGNDWVFSIDKATASVRLPAGVPRDAIEAEAYTGRYGKTERNYAARVDAEGAVQFRTTAPLAAGEGLTLVVSWPKGFVAAPTPWQKSLHRLRDNPEILVAILGIALVLAYYLSAWFKAGRDPARGTIVTLYEPPGGWSPSAMRYLLRRGYDEKTFTASVLSMAVKGYLTIRQEKHVYTLARAQAGADVLAPEEQKVGEYLFKEDSQLELTSLNHEKVSAATSGLIRSLSERLEGAYFVTNTQYLLRGLGLSAPVVAATIVFAPHASILRALVYTVLLLIWGGVQGVALGGILRILAGASKGEIGKLFWLVLLIPLSALVALFGLVLFVSLGKASSSVVAAALAALIALAFLFSYLLEAPTEAGRALLDKVEGFKQFLTAVEADRLQRAGGPEMTPELFEKYLPYAVALNVEQAWAEKFSRAMAVAGESPAAPGGYAPQWYAGEQDILNVRDVVGFASSFDTSFASAVTAASTAPSSASSSSGEPGYSSGRSDDSGGGGYSGGGRGGGGGGGW